MTVLVGLIADWVTVITPFTGPVSELPDVLAIETVARSLSAIVLVATSGLPNVARPDVMLERVTVTVSESSIVLSLITGMLIVAVLAPAKIVTVPESAV